MRGGRLSVDSNRGLLAPLFVGLAISLATIVVLTSFPSQGSNDTLQNLSLSCSAVSVEFGTDKIVVSVSLPGPQYYNYSYQGYEETAIPVTVIAAVEKLENGVPILLESSSVVRYVYTSDNTAELVFHVAPGHYLVKVLFWNSHLAQLSLENKPWKVLGGPCLVEGDVGSD